MQGDIHAGRVEGDKDEAEFEAAERRFMPRQRGLRPSFSGRGIAT